MPDIGTSVYDYLGKKPKAISQERLAQTAKVNALANTMSLLSQGIMGTRGAHINPMKDVVTPYVMSEFDRQRQIDFAQEQQERQLMLRELIKRQDVADKRSYDENVYNKRTSDKRGYEETQTENQRQWQEQRDEKLGNTAPQKEKRAALSGGNDMKEYYEKQEYQKQQDQEKEVVFNVGPNKEYGLTKRDVNSLSDVVTKAVSQKPELKEQLKAYGFEIGRTDKEWGSLNDAQKQIVIQTIWPYIGDEVVKMKGTSKQSQTGTAQKTKISW